MSRLMTLYIPTCSLWLISIFWFTFMSLWSIHNRLLVFGFFLTWQTIPQVHYWLFHFCIDPKSMPPGIKLTCEAFVHFCSPLSN
jgi:hypothetical protein